MVYSSDAPIHRISKYQMGMPSPQATKQESLEVFVGFLKREHYYCILDKNSDYYTLETNLTCLIADHSLLQVRKKENSVESMFYYHIEALISI